MNTNDTVKALEGIDVGSILFVSYVPGRKPSPRAVQEGRRAIVEEGLSPRHFTGKLSSVSRTKKGEVVFTLWVEERDSVQDGMMRPGAYRAFNPSLGRLLILEVVQKA